jgi:hypothetical protein
MGASLTVLKTTFSLLKTGPNKRICPFFPVLYAAKVQFYALSSMPNSKYYSVDKID